MKLFDRIKKVVNDNENEKKSLVLFNDKSLKQNKCKVTGTKYYENNILKLGKINQNYSKVTKKDIELYGTIYKYIFEDSYQIDLIDDVDNPVNPNAIKVLFNGIHVGYIKDGSLTRVRNLLKNSSNILGKVSGGPCKTSDIRNGDLYMVEENGNIHCTIYIFTKIKD